MARTSTRATLRTLHVKHAAWAASMPRDPGRSVMRARGWAIYAVMDEPTYQKLADATFRAIGDAFDDVDAELVDCEIAGDVVTLTLPGARRCIVNTQRPTRQIWLAANSTAWHFSWDEGAKRWLDDKGRGELYATLARIVKEATGADVRFA